MEHTDHDSARGHRGPDLLAAGRRMFFERGYAGTTVESVARAAGLSKRSVYLYFKNKDELFIAVASEGIALLQRRLESLELDSASIDELMTATSEHYLRFATDEPEYFRIIFQEATSQMMDNVSDELRQTVARQERACLGVVATIVERGIREGVIPPVDPWETALIFWGTVTGIILLSLGGSQTVFGRETREKLIAKAVLVLREGVKALRPSDQTAAEEPREP